MTTTKVVLSSKGQLVLPKKIREADALEAHDVFRLERLGPGKYTLERLAQAKLPKAKLVRGKDGLPIFKVPPGTPKITSELVKKLEAETI
jgi:bifunctional DNA-binding transcriptional regulator/antitoxin component of YhaV-PrlF toxin-antitoxin module